jgi:hypothetical protein
MNAIVERALIELFKAVADAVDGGDPLPPDVKSAYDDEFAKPEVQKFYLQLIDHRQAEVFGTKRASSRRKKAIKQ